MYTPLEGYSSIKRLALGGLFIATVSLATFTTVSADEGRVSHGDSNWVTVTPLPYDRALRNPLKGFTQNAWNFNEWATLSMNYFRWNDLERDASDGVERILAVSNERWRNLPQGMKVIPRVFLDWPGQTPRWPSDMEVGDYTSEQFQERVVRLVENLGAVWNNDPHVAFVEMGIIGLWGEQHGPSPTAEIQELMSEVFLRAFPDRQVSVRHPWNEFTPGKFATYWDSWAHYQQMYAHGLRIAQLNEEGYWRRHYIGGEVAYGWGDWEIQPGRTQTDSVALPVHRDYIINSIRWLHGTQLRWISAYNANNPEASAGAEEMQKVFGYRYLLEETGFPAQVQPDEPFEVVLKVRNEGAAPFYYDWPLELSLLDPETREPVWRSNFEGVDIRDWLSGSGFPEPEWLPYDKWPRWVGEWPEGPLEYANPAIQYTVEGQFVADVPEGEYILAVAILDPAGNVPSVRFATGNYINGGRHPIGMIAVGDGQGGPLPTDFAFDDPHTDNSLHYIVPSATLLPDFSYERHGGDFPRTVEFDARASGAVGTEIESYAWDFNDNGEIDATGPVVTRTFQAAGSHVTRLIVTDDQGNANTITRRIIVPQASTWGGFPLEEDGRTVDTGAKMGKVDISGAPWIYSFALKNFLYLPVSLLADNGGWMYAFGTGESSEKMAFGESSWFYFPALHKFAYSPESANLDHGAWMYVF